MKTTRFIIAAVAIAAAVSCSKEGFNGETGKESAKIVTGEMTKTSLNGKEIHWTSDDQIAVFDNAGVKNVFSIIESNGSYASFSGSVTSGTTQIYAVYPQNLATSASGSTLKVNIPTDQTSKEGSFAEEHNISVAKGTKVPGNEEIAGVVFKNVCGLLKFTVPAYVEDAKSVTFSSNSVIAGELTVDYSGDVPSVQVTGASKSVTMRGSYPAGSQFIFVLAPGTVHGFTVTVTTDKATWSISKDVDVVLEPGKYKNLGTLEFEQASAVSASAAHTYENGILTGTDVTLNLNIPEAAGKYITELNLQVKNAQGTEVRTVSKSNASATEVIGANDNWPYLPYGTYTVTGTYTLSGNVVKELGTVMFTSEKPKYTLKSNAHSSYTKYIEGDSESANKCDPMVIASINSATPSISETILNNSNYIDIIGAYEFTLNGSTYTKSSYTATAYGPNSVTAAFSFDGVEMTDEANCHITGLPYTFNPSTNDSVNAWSTSGNIKWNDSGAIRLGYNLSNWFASEKASITKNFNLPDNINIITNCSGTTNGTSAQTTEFRIQISGTDVYTITSGKETSKVPFDSGDKNSTMTNESPTVVCSNSRGTSQACSRIASLMITYGNKK